VHVIDILISGGLLNEYCTMKTDGQLKHFIHAVFVFIVVTETSITLLESLEGWVTSISETINVPLLYLLWSSSEVC